MEFWHPWTREGVKAGQKETKDRAGGPGNFHEVKHTFLTVNDMEGNKNSSQQSFQKLWVLWYSLVWPVITNISQPAKWLEATAKAGLWIMTQIPSNYRNMYLRYFILPQVIPRHCLTGGLFWVWCTLHLVTSICDVEETNTILTSGTEHRKQKYSGQHSLLCTDVCHLKQSLVLNDEALQMFTPSPPSSAAQSMVTHIKGLWLKWKSGKLTETWQKTKKGFTNCVFSEEICT